MVVPSFVRQAVRGEPITVYGDGEQSRCFTHVADVVVALYLLLDRAEARGQVFNVGSDHEISILQLAKRVREAVGSQSEVQFIPYAEAYAEGFEDMRRRVPSVDKLRALGWSTTHSLDDIINDVVSYERGRR